MCLHGTSLTHKIQITSHPIFLDTQTTNINISYKEGRYLHGDYENIVQIVLKINIIGKKGIPTRKHIRLVSKNEQRMYDCIACSKN